MLSHVWILDAYMGAKPFYGRVEDMQKSIDLYFDNCPKDEITITGLALHLGFTTRQALINYEDKPEFVDAIKKAKMRVENSYELSLRKNGRSGDIFALKNFNWKDTQIHAGDAENPIVLGNLKWKDEASTS